MNTIIEVQSFGDFNVKYTDSIMVHDDKLDKEEILKEFCALKGIKSNKGLDYKILNRITEEFVLFLESKGFKRLKTDPIYFCD